MNIHVHIFLNQLSIPGNSIPISTILVSSLKTLGYTIANEDLFHMLGRFSHILEFMIISSSNLCVLCRCTGIMYVVVYYILCMLLCASSTSKLETTVNTRQETGYHAGHHAGGNHCAGVHSLSDSFFCLFS